MAVKRARGWWLVAGSCLLLARPGIVAGQQVPAAPLKPTNATFKAAFSNVHAMHELKDGRVLMSDMRAGMVVVADFTTGRGETIRDVNAGPMVALAGDSSVMWGGPGSPWIFFEGSHVIGMLDRSNPVVKAVQWIYGADAKGNLLTMGGSGTKPGQAFPDSGLAVIVNRTTGDTMPLVQLSMDQRTATSRAAGQGSLFVQYEQGILMLDGWVAVLRAKPYRVDWRTPSGEWIPGAPIVGAEVKLDDREKRAYMIARAARRGGAVEPPETITNWPDVIPAWSAGWELLATPDGKVLVRRNATADAPDTRFDVINRRGELERQVMMAANEHILGFGAKSIYIVVTGKDGTQNVERHPWP